jgi:hypothetical protein
MGDCQNEDLRVGFDGRLKLKLLGSQITTVTNLNQRSKNVVKFYNGRGTRST